MERTIGVVAVLMMMTGCGLGEPTAIPADFTGTETSSGSFGGSTDASEFDSSCRGFVSSGPDHQLQLAGELPYGRFMVNGGSADTTLVVQTPDGTYHCNDDGEGLNPIVELEGVPAGLVKVWVGAYSSSNTGNYRFGFSTDRTATAASLGAPIAPSSRPRRRSRRRRGRRR